VHQLGPQVLINSRIRSEMAALEFENFLVNALDFVECYDPAVEDAGLIDAALFVHSVITYEPDALVHGPQYKSRGSALKTADELVMEIGVAVQPPPGVASVLTEEPGALPNWVAAAGIMEAALTDKFSEKVAELITTDPLVDGNEVDKGQSEFHRVVKFLSAAE
jgi:hypothetical protein